MAEEVFAESNDDGDAPEYLVKWQGHFPEESTLEPYANIASVLLLAGLATVYILNRSYKRSTARKHVLRFILIVLSLPALPCTDVWRTRSIDGRKVEILIE
jgi:hypothetical protein